MRIIIFQGSTIPLTHLDYLHWVLQTLYIQCPISTTPTGPLVVLLAICSYSGNLLHCYLPFVIIVIPCNQLPTTCNRTFQPTSDYLFISYLDLHPQNELLFSYGNQLFTLPKAITWFASYYLFQKQCILPFQGSKLTCTIYN